MSAVVDASSLIALGRAGLLDLLPAIYGDVFVPHAVRQEAIENRPKTPGAESIRQALRSSVLKAVEVQKTGLLERLTNELDAGEAETIAYAREVAADVVILDDKTARRVAKSMGFRVIGTAGVLGRARHRGLVSAVAPILERLRAEGIRISTRVIEEARQEDARQ